VNGYSARRPIAALCAAVLVAALTVPDATGAGLLKPVGGRDAGAHIKSHHVEVVLNNGFAQVVVDQVFGNDSDADFEACYSFPVPKSASLSELSLWIGGKEVLGEVVEKEKTMPITIPCHQVAGLDGWRRCILRCGRTTA